MRQMVTFAIIAGQLVVGGAERQLYLWLANLDRQKFQPIVLTLHPEHNDYWEKPIESLGIPLLRIPHRQIQLIRMLDIVRVLSPYQPQLIHGWHSFASPYAGVSAKLLGSKSLGGLRDSFRIFCKNPVVAGLTLCLADAMLVNSYSAAEQLQAFSRASKDTIHVVQNAVENQINNRFLMREQLSNRFGFSIESLWIGSLGRLDPKKQFGLLLKVIALLREDFKDFHFLLIGDGPERLHLEKIAETLGIADCVTFAGEIVGASAWLSALDIFCFTSLDEGLPNVVMEAAVANVPIVAWRVSFVEELMGADRTALLVNPENLGDFKDALLELIGSKELRIKIGKVGREHILEKFSLNRFVQQMTNVYENLLDIQPKRVFLKRSGKIGE